METQLNFFSQRGVTISLNITRFPEEYKTNPKLIIKASNYLVSYHKKIKERLDIVKLISDVFYFFDRNRQYNYAEEIADCLFRYNGTLLYITYIEEKKEPVVKIEKNTVYRDKQNVHNSKINKTVIQAVEILFLKYKNLFIFSDIEKDNFEYKIEIIKNIEKYLTENYGDNREIIKYVLNYISESSSSFGNNIKLQDIFISVWFFILENKDKKELEKRLIQEIIEMKGQCATGHVSRLINVFQGFTEDKNLQIQITEIDQYNSVIKNYLQKCLSECQDEKIIEQALEGGENYICYIRLQISKKLREWVKEYGEAILDYIPKIVNDFAGFQVFNVSS